MFANAQVVAPTCPRDTINGTIYYHYVVEKSIGLWRISQNFGVSQEEIIQHNPQLRERGLHVDEVLLIPTHISGAVADTVVVDVTSADTIVTDTIATDTIVTDTIVTDAIVAIAQDSTIMRIALLLPLHANAVQRDAQMERFLDFYEGALLAINDIQQSLEDGQKIEVNVYDVEKSDSKIKQLIADSVLNRMDAIIGPAYPLQVMHIATFCKEKQIPTIIPFSDQVPEIEHNPYLIQFNANEVIKAKALADYLQERGDSINCVLIEAKEADIPVSIRAVRQEIIRRKIPHTMTTIRSILVDSMGTALRDSVENIILFNTEKYGNLQMLMTRLVAEKGDKRLTLMSQYSWQKERIVLPQLYTTMFETNLAADCSHYDAAFDTYFGHEHSSINPRYDLLGYDITRFMVAFLQGKEYLGLQSDIQVESIVEGGGYINTNVVVKRR